MATIDKKFIIYSKNIINDFYKDFDSLNIKNIDSKTILKLKSLTPNLLEKEFITNNNFVNYIKKMKRLLRDEKYKEYTNTEKYILFMLSVDPNFEAFKIHGECDKINEIKFKMILYFGNYDFNLIKIENEFVKNFFTKEELNKLNNEIDKRVFK